MSSKKDDTEGQSDRTVMLTADDVSGNRTAQDMEPYQEPQPGQSDQTVLGIQLPPELVAKEPPTLDEQATAAAMPVAPAPAPRAKTGVRKALDPSAGEPPRAKTGTRKALDPTGTEPPRAKTGTRKALEVPPRAEDATLPPQNKRGTSQRPALPDPAPAADPTMDGATLMLGGDGAPAPDLSSSTVIFDSNRKLPGADLASGDEETASRNLAGDDKPTAAKRPLQDLVDAGTAEAEPTAVKPKKKSKPEADPDAGPSTHLTEQNKGLKGFQYAVAAILLLVAGAVGARLLSQGVSKPTEDELRLAYPFGQAGATMPNGRSAPGVNEVEFRYDGSVKCDQDTCLRYLAYKEGSSFQYEMVLRRTEDAWTLVSTLSESK